MSEGLALDRVRIRLGNTELLSLERSVRPGTVLTVMGPSGSGKSTLLSYIAGFLTQPFTAEGRVLLDGEDITDRAPEQRHVGLLFQDPMLFPHLSVGGNLLFGMPPGLSGRRARAADALARFGLEGFAGRDPATLSGGQASRVALLRLLLSEPRAALLDEPFSKLDRHLRADIRTFTFDRLREAQLPTVLVTHDPEDAEAAGGPVVELTF
ncbi:ATP-binding cassette domain-containing protein [Nisaea acidiphila]|uniref:ATP-binding cassette domain-containing protein n=1 Tax=Nisaea acidiphila TaxID=1862145 RepID=A0A9J7AW08_9PROT|nr:ATP-binding cassette domain-containing protein [Nisaea acidiphila]UUX50633.1 ATP-binding cassette domain-containing protein [Nisaea acidiphila]